MGAANLVSRVNEAIKVLIIERRMPQSWSKRWHEWRYLSAFERSIKRAAHIKCLPSADKPLAELHIVTCKRDLYMAVVAVKSLLRFAPNLGVVFHGDQSLTVSDSNFLQSQIPGCRVVLIDEADRIAQAQPDIHELRQALPGRFKLASGYESQRKAWALKVFDFHLLARSDRVIVLDSDTIFLKPPAEIIEFIEGRRPEGFYAVPCHSNLKVSTELLKKYYPNASVPLRFNGGLLGFERSSMPISMLQDVTQKVIQNEDILVMGDECLWRFAFGHSGGKELEFSRYPLTTDILRSRELEKNMDDLVYIHFILKHKGGFYQRVVERVAVELDAAEFGRAEVRGESQKGGL